MKNKGLMQRAGQGIARGASVANIGLAGLLSSCLSQYGEQLTRNVGETIVYTQVGQVLLQTTKENIKDGLTRKKELIGIRLKSLEQQEKKMVSMMDETRNTLTKKKA